MFFFLLKSHAAISYCMTLQATVRQVHMEASGFTAPLLYALWRSAPVYSSSKGNKNCYKPRCLCSETPNGNISKALSDHPILLQNNQTWSTSVRSKKNKEQYLWVTTKQHHELRKDYFLSKCEFLLSISSIAPNTISACWLLSSSDSSSIVDLSLDAKINIFLRLEN
jgi:hypothetical protein